MAYVHKNGIRYATQFHPEHYYHFTNDSATDHQRTLLDNFIDIATMHHNDVVGNTHQLHDYLEQLKCLGEGYISNDIIQ